MKIGDLVKRKEWDDEWTLTYDEANEIGIIIGIEEFSTKEGIDNLMVVYWTVADTCWEELELLEVISESR